MKKVDLGYSFAISLLVGLFLLPILVSTDLYSKLPTPLVFIGLFGILPVVTLVGISIAWFIGKKIAILWQFSKFALVGVLNTAIDFGILNLLILLTGITSGLGIIPLNAVSFTTAVINSFFWNKKWVFQSRKDANFLTFFAITLIGLLLNSGIVYIITTFVPPVLISSETLWVNMAKVLATGVSLVWNFTGYKLIVFKNRER